MSGGETVGKEVEQILQKVDLASIPDERTRESMRECIRQLLNLVEALNVGLQKAQAEILALRKQLQGQGGGGHGGPPDPCRETSPRARGLQRRSAPRGRNANTTNAASSTGFGCNESRFFPSIFSSCFPAVFSPSTRLEA
jgi:hypothetical protein